MNDIVALDQHCRVHRNRECTSLILTFRVCACHPPVERGAQTRKCETRAHAVGEIKNGGYSWMNGKWPWGPCFIIVIGRQDTPALMPMNLTLPYLVRGKFVPDNKN